MKRLLLWLTPTLLLAVAGLLSILLFTEAGLKWTFRIAQTQIPGELNADSLRGRLIGPVDISGLQYRDNDGLDLRVGRVSMTWQPMRLFSGTVLIHELSLRDIDIYTAAADDEIDEPAQDRSALEAFAFELPIPVRIEHFELSNAAWHPPEGEPVEVNEFRFSAMARESWITISGLHLDMPQLTLDAEGLVPLASDGTVRVDLRFRSELDGQTWSGRTTLRGTADDIDIDLGLDTPISALGEGRVRAFADPLRWDFSAGITEPFSLDALAADLRPVTLNAVEIEASGFGNEIDGSVHLAARDEEFGRWGADAEGQWDGQQWRIDDFVLAALETGTRVTGRGRQQGETGFDIDLQWEEVAWPLTGEPVVGSPDGAVAVSGTLDDYVVRLDGRVITSDLPAIDLSLEGKGDSESLVIEALTMDWLNGQWHVGGRVAWLPVPSWNVELTAQAVEPSLLYPGAEGLLDARARIDGSFDEVLALEIDVEDVSGTLRDFPFDSRARLSLDDDVIDIRDLRVRSGDNELQGNARIADEWEIDWHIDAHDLAVLDPQLAGRLESSGTLNGPPEALHARITARGSGLSWQEHGLESLTLDADMVLMPDGHWQAAVSADGIHTAGRNIGRVQITTTGTMQDHVIDFDLLHEDYRFTQQFSGGLVDVDDLQWEGILRDGVLEQEHAGAWSQQTSTLQISAARQTLEEYCWAQRESVICLDATHHGDEAHARLHWEGINLNRIEPFLPDERMTINGALRGEIKAAWLGDRPGPLHVDIHGDPGAFSFPLPGEEEPQEINFESIHLDAHADEQQGVSAEFRLMLNENEHLGGRLRMPQWRLPEPVPDPEHEIDAGLELELRDMSLLALLVPELQTGPGRFGAALDINGTAGAPRFNGRAGLGFEHLELTQLGIRLDDVDLQTDITHNEWTLVGSSRMDQGLLEITGSGEAHDATDWRGEVTIVGDNLQTLRQPGLNLVTSPAITLTISPRELVFGGRLTIPSARIEPVATQSAVPVSADVVIIGEEVEVAEPGAFTTHGRIEIILGDQVRVTGMGFDGRLAGQLLVIVGRDGSLTGQGEIRVVDGRYRAYGQNLTITQGRIMYAGGPLDNPAIDIVASRMRGDIEVGVRITGTAEQPMATLFSDPAMDDGDVLSYLVLGRPLDQAGEGDGQLLHQAATSVALAGGEVIAEQISERFGIDEVAIEAGDEVADTALVLGRAISDRIYIRYIQGLVENVNAFQVRYKISDKWTLETESGTRSGAGADILYSLER